MAETLPDPSSNGRKMGGFEHCVVLASVVLPTVGVCLFFSVMGYGDDTYVWLNDQHYSTSGPFCAAAGLAVLLHVLDSGSWEGGLVFLRYVAFSAMALFVGVGCCLAAKTYPYASLQFAMLLIPATVYFARRVLMPTVPTWRFFVSLSFSLTAVACGVLFYFTLWVFVLDPPASRINTGWNPDWTNYWGGAPSAPRHSSARDAPTRLIISPPTCASAGDVKRYWRRRLECVPYNASALDDTDCYEAAFLWWFFPVLVSLALLLFSLTCRLLSRTLKPTSANPDVKLVKTLIQAPQRVEPPFGTKIFSSPIV